MRISRQSALATIYAGLYLVTARAEPPPAAEVSPPDPDRFHLRTAPIGVLFGVFGANADVGVLNNLSLGPGYSVFDVSSATATIQVRQLGVAASYFPLGPRFESGPVFRATASYLRVTVTPVADGSLEAGRLHNWIAGATGGYHWRISRSGLTFALGTGVSYYHAPSLTRFRVSSANRGNYTLVSAQGFQPMLECSIGWAF